MKTQRKYSIDERKREGWGLNLYRNKAQGHIAGVCAGIAEHFDVDNWVVRLVFLAGFIFLNGVAVFAYIAGWVLLADRSSETPLAYEYDEKRHQYRTKKMFKYSDAASIRLQSAQRRLKEALQRVEAMERYVTSTKFNVDQAFADLDKKDA